ncbi:osomolarity two-component system, response regulator SKN7 [Metschnikowia aff. pulcherrima]|uniref:Transcription factor n=2 Tax=Metschnikowia TaxID=27320 RepID=A0A4V1AEZ3_9ASCO|nr:hypothetical protein HF325_004409 [Metschnikowia pulcherrima]QBM90913.1 osomolarity two-component system, response regulator SKN7 [Metschnikowia aff. pulcherrima]
MAVAPKEDTALNGLNDFVKKLYQMLLQDKYLDVVRWTPQGTSFVVLNTNEFTKVILPTHFKHSNFASFVRQLNKYDFHKVKITNEQRQTYAYGDDAWEFQHPDFRRDDMDALENIRRKAPTKKEPVQENTQLQALVDQMKKDMSALKNELRVTNEKLRAVSESAMAHRTYNERQFRLMGMLVHCLTQAGIKVPPLDLPNPNLISMVQPPRQEKPPPLAARPDPKLKPDLHLRQHSREVKFEPVSTTLVPNAKFHVLLVEDDNVCIQLCRKFLMKYGCQVTVVTDGLNAILTVEHTKYDLVLMDIVMPNLDGATATSIIRLFDTKTPIIAMTGNIQDNDLVTYLQNGMLDILAKPFTKDDLYLILSKYLLGPKLEFLDLPPVPEFASMPLEGASQQVPLPQIPRINPTPPLPQMMEPMEALEPQQKKLRMH